MDRRSFIAAFLASLASFALVSCAAFDALRPALSRSALVFIQEIETLLREYETAQAFFKSRCIDISGFSTSQDALYRDISTRLKHPPAGFDKRVLDAYHRRLAAAEKRPT